MSRYRGSVDSYEYVRNCYGVPAYIGVRVRVRGREGVIVKPRCSDQYVHILFDGDKRITGPFHPTDGIEYMVATSDPVVLAGSEPSGAK